MKRLGSFFLLAVLPLAPELGAAQDVIEVTLREGTNLALALSPDGQTIARTKAVVERNRQNLAEREERLARLGKVVKDIQDAGGASLPGRILPSCLVRRAFTPSFTISSTPG